MTGREQPYRCAACGWQAMLDPEEAGNAPPCPRCGVYPYHRSRVAGWGFTLLLVGGTLGLVLAAAFTKW